MVWLILPFLLPAAFVWLMRLKTSGPGAVYCICAAPGAVGSDWSVDPNVTERG